jgi:hypothetical protein
MTVKKVLDGRIYQMTVTLKGIRPPICVITRGFSGNSYDFTLGSATVPSTIRLWRSSMGVLGRIAAPSL